MLIQIQARSLPCCHQHAIYETPEGPENAIVFCGLRHRASSPAVSSTALKERHTLISDSRLSSPPTFVFWSKRHLKHGPSPIKSPSCSSPRAWTSKASEECRPGSTLRETLLSASLLSRSPILVLVRCCPERPASGESFGENIILQGGAFDQDFVAQ